MAGGGGSRGNLTPRSQLTTRRKRAQGGRRWSSRHAFELKCLSFRGYEPCTGARLGHGGELSGIEAKVQIDCALRFCVREQEPVSFLFGAIATTDWDWTIIKRALGTRGVSHLKLPRGIAQKGPLSANRH